MRKFLIVLGSLFVLACGLNYRWVHAAVVVAASPSQTCPERVVDSAKSRVNALFTGVRSAPWLLCLQEPMLGLGENIGTTNFAPGFPSIIIVSHEGADVDVIAHEWAHAELAERVGVLSRTYVLPTWFDEGLAMQVDYREKYDLDALAALEADSNLVRVNPEDLVAPDNFFRAGDQGVLHYAWSRRQVSELLRKDPLDVVLQGLMGEAL